MHRALLMEALVVPQFTSMTQASLSMMHQMHQASPTTMLTAWPAHIEPSSTTPHSSFSSTAAPMPPSSATPNSSLSPAQARMPPSSTMHNISFHTAHMPLSNPTLYQSLQPRHQALQTSMAPLNTTLIPSLSLLTVESAPSPSTSSELPQQRNCPDTGYSTPQAGQRRGPQRKHW